MLLILTIQVASTLKQRRCQLRTNLQIHISDTTPGQQECKTKQNNKQPPRHSHHLPCHIFITAIITKPNVLEIKTSKPESKTNAHPTNLTHIMHTILCIHTYDDIRTWTHLHQQTNFIHFHNQHISNHHIHNTIHHATTCKPIHPHTNTITSSSLIQPRASKRMDHSCVCKTKDLPMGAAASSVFFVSLLEAG